MDIQWTFNKAFWGFMPPILLVISEVFLLRWGPREKNKEWLRREVTYLLEKLSEGQDKMELQEKYRSIEFSLPRIRDRAIARNAGEQILEQVFSLMRYWDMWSQRVKPEHFLADHVIKQVDCDLRLLDFFLEPAWWYSYYKEVCNWSERRLKGNERFWELRNKNM